MSTQANRHLKSFVDRIQRLKDEQDARAADIREVYAEAKAMGFDKTALGQVVSILRKREKDGEKFEVLSATVELYLHALEKRDTDGESGSRRRSIAASLLQPASTF